MEQTLLFFGHPSLSQGLMHFLHILMRRFIAVPFALDPKLGCLGHASGKAAQKLKPHAVNPKSLFFLGPHSHASLIIPELVGNRGDPKRGV